MPGLPLVVGDTFEKVKGASWWFANVKPDVAAGAPFPLALDPTGTFKTPLDTDNPNGFCLGCTNDGWKINSEFSVSNEFCDESTTPEFSSIDSSSMTLEGNIRNPINEKILLSLWGMTKDAIPADAWDVYSGGAIAAVPQMAIVGIFRNPKDVTKYGYLYFPKCELVTTFNLDQITRKKVATSLVRFSILSNPSRGLGKDVFDLGKEK